MGYFCIILFPGKQQTDQKILCKEKTEAAASEITYQESPLNNVYICIS